MNWKTKAHILAVLSRLPGGRSMYHKLQTAFGTNRLNVAEGVTRAMELVELIYEGGRQLHGASVVEIGTGWRPFVPFVFYLLGAESIQTFDINPWLNRDYAFETFRALEDQIESIATRAGVDEAFVRNRYLRATPGNETLDGLLRGFHVKYVYPGDARATGLKTGSVDFVVSSNVLEHVQPEILSVIHTESRRILGVDGLAVHRFNPEDHYVAVDQSITGANFLQFSERQWKWYGGTGLAYHNRLRCCEHRELFDRAGLDLRVDRRRMDQRALSAIKDGSLKVHADFARFTPEDLATDYMWTVGVPREVPPLSATGVVESKRPTGRFETGPSAEPV